MNTNKLTNEQISILQDDFRKSFESTLLMNSNKKNFEDLRKEMKSYGANLASILIRHVQNDSRHW